MLGSGLLKGLKTTLRAFLSRPVTLMWPYEKIKIADRGQGLIRLRMTQLDPPVFKCVACKICEANCPQHCITVVKKDGERQPEIYKVDYSLCMFCRVCIDVCPYDALEQTQEHEYIGLSRKEFFRDKEELMMKTVYVEPEKIKEAAKETTKEAVKENTEEAAAEGEGGEKS